MVDNDEKHLDGVDGDADALWLDVAGVGLGATTETETYLFSQELGKWEKPF